MKCVLVLVLCACHNDSPATADAPPCQPFDGEFVDWDSTDSTFCGIFDAVWTVRGDADPAATHHSNPNGRVDLCLPAGAPSVVDITPPTGPSQCVAGSYAGAGIAVIDPTASAGFSARFYTTVRRTTAIPNYDAAKAQVFVHVATGAARATTTATHDPAQAWSGTAWAAGDSGVDVQFPNVTVPGSGMVTVTVGAHSTDVPVAAGTISYAMLAP